MMSLLRMRLLLLLAALLTASADAQENNKSNPFNAPAEKQDGEPANDNEEEEKDEGSDDDDHYSRFSKWAGLDRYGINFGVDWALNWTGVPVGGTAPGRWTKQNLGLVALNVDLERAIGWKGGTFETEFLHRRGSIDTTLVGDVLDLNGFDAELPSSRGELYELWFQQEFLDGAWRVLLGKVNPNNYFGVSENSGVFLGNGYGTLSGMVQFSPQFPDSTTGIQVWGDVNERYTIGFGWYDGRHGGQGIATGQRGPQFNGYYFYIGEFHIHFELGDDDLKGRLALGGWGQTGALDRWDGGEQDGTEGFYIMLDQMLWKECGDDDDDQGIAGFLTYSYGDGDVNLFTHGITVGFQWTGALRNRDEDIWGAGLVWSALTPTFGVPETVQAQAFPDLAPPFDNGMVASGEWEWQCFYNAKVNDYINVMPTLTYIHDPGRSTAIGDVFAFTMSVFLSF